jgi:hypothetical protein
MGSAKMIELNTIRNRKGDIPIIFNLIVALVLIIMALVVIVSIRNDFTNGSEGRNGVISNVLFYQAYILEKVEVLGRESIKIVGQEGGDLEIIFKNLANEKNLGIIGTQNFFGKVFRDGVGGRDEFSFVRIGDGYEFRMDEVFVEFEKGANRMKRSFDIKIEFDSKGKVIKKKGVEK